VRQFPAALAGAQNDLVEEQPQLDKVLCLFGNGLA